MGKRVQQKCRIHTCCTLLPNKSGSYHDTTHLESGSSQNAVCSSALPLRFCFGWVNREPGARKLHALKTEENSVGTIRRVPLVRTRIGWLTRRRPSDPTISMNSAPSIRIDAALRKNKTRSALQAQMRWFPFPAAQLLAQMRVHLRSDTASILPPPPPSSAAAASAAGCALGAPLTRVLTLHRRYMRVPSPSIHACTLSSLADVGSNSEGCWKQLKLQMFITLHSELMLLLAIL